MQEREPHPMEYMTAALFYWHAAKTLIDLENNDDEAGQTIISYQPVYFLVCHATELYLKGALLKRGFTHADLKKPKLRHNLIGLAEALAKSGVSIPRHRMEEIGQLSYFHSQHLLRYGLFRIGADTFHLTVAGLERYFSDLLGYCHSSSNPISSS